MIFFILFVLDEKSAIIIKISIVKHKKKNKGTLRECHNQTNCIVRNLR